MAVEAIEARPPWTLLDARPMRTSLLRECRLAESADSDLPVFRMCVELCFVLGDKPDRVCTM